MYQGQNHNVLTHKEIKQGHAAATACVTLACYRLSVSGDDRKSGRATSGVCWKKREVKSSNLSFHTNRNVSYMRSLIQFLVCAPPDFVSAKRPWHISWCVYVLSLSLGNVCGMGLFMCRTPYSRLHNAASRYREQEVIRMSLKSPCKLNAHVIRIEQLIAQGNCFDV